ncbi:MAG: hypothetical protein GMKNLPBB_01778 [Myxococcota bacterium]|nr:hypothetical protein [Myxococcota bacterium]
MKNLAARHHHGRERAFEWICLFSILAPLTLLALFLLQLLADASPRLSFEFLTQYPSRKAEIAGIYPALIGSLCLIALTAVLAIPLGVGAAIYLEEYARKNLLNDIIEVNIANLAGVPSIIYGLLGLELFVRTIGFGRSLIAGACTLALLIIPMVIIASREALRTVPNDMREGSLALGATRWQTIRQVVLPVASPGILTGCILSVSRAIGETAPLVVVGAMSYVNFLPDSVFSPFTALPLQIFNWVSRPQKAFMMNAAAGIVVLVITLTIMNAVAIWLRNRFEGKWTR